MEYLVILVGCSFMFTFALNFVNYGFRVLKELNE